MPKPTFFQSVLRKPTRSYADPNYIPPWSDNYDAYDEDRSSVVSYRPASRYSARVDEGVFLGYREGYEAEAGPSRPRKSVSVKAPRSTISTHSEEPLPSAGTRFPKAARRVASSVVVRGGQVHEVLDDRDGVPSRSSTIKKKKKVVRRADSEYSESVMTASRPHTPALSTRSARRVRRPPMEDDDDNFDGESYMPPLSRSSTNQTPSTPSLQSRNRTTPSQGSASSVPISIPDETPRAVRRKPVPTQKAPLNQQTRPSPKSTVSNGSRQVQERISSPPVAAPSPEPQRRPVQRQVESRPAKRVSVVREETDDEQAYFTPRQSMDVRPVPPRTAVPAIRAAPSTKSQLPTLALQPPTPAPLEINTTPFHSEPSSTNSSLHPDQALGATEPEPINNESSRIQRDEDAHSAAGEAGSDEEEENQPRQSTSSLKLSRPPSESDRISPVRAASRPASVAYSMPSGSVIGSTRSKRLSENPRNAEFQRRYSGAVSEASFGGKSRAESFRSSASGFGKGGWAAAAASSTSPTTMFMPANGNNGWESFHVPPRQSKFTPLPQASQPMTFDTLVRDRPIAASAPASRMGDRIEGIRSAHTAVSGQSSASSYSQVVDEQAVEDSSDEEEDDGDDDLPKPSRSYARPGSTSISEPGMPASGFATSRATSSSATSSPPIPPPKNPSRGLMAQMAQYGSDSSLQNSDNDSGPHDTGAAGMVYLQSNRNFTGSNSLSLPTPGPNYHPAQIAMNGDQHSSDPSREVTPQSTEAPSLAGTRPTSPSLSRPNTPGGGRTFEPPSFLNPDVLTVLPEMTLEDSAKTYQHTPSESGRSKRSTWQDSGNGLRRSNSLWAGRARSVRSERGEEEDREELPPRSQSVMGFKRGGSKWGGSSYGDGQLMQSDGRGESVSGYTNLILPSGAYTPLNPTKSPSAIDSRVLGLPHASMAAITLSTSAHRLPMTPMHLRANLPAPVDFSSHLKPPIKTGDGQILVQVYAVAVDEVDIEALEEKGIRDVGKWVPGRSFVGRCLMVGAAEKEIVRGDIVLGLLDIRKSGALAEYILVDRRRLARAPYPTSLTLEQLALLPLQGIAATRAIRAHVHRLARALIMDAHTGVGALICQEMSRAAMYVVALIGGGDNHHEAQTSCMRNGAKGVMTGNPAAVMNGLEEFSWDFIFDTAGGPRVYEAAKRILKDNATLVSTASPEPSVPPATKPVKQSGFKAFKAAFRSKKKDQKNIVYEYIPPTGSGEPEVDSSGVDCRDVLEEPCMSTFRPDVRVVYPLERGMDAFRSPPETSVVRLIN